MSARALLAVLLTSLALTGQAMAAPPKTVQVARSDYGPVIFDGRGFALYAFTRDKVGKSICAGACAAAWPPYLASKLRAGAGIKTRLLGTIRRSNGALQVTYGGHPLYYYVGDNHPGEILCHGVREFGGLWQVVRGNGKPVR